MKEYATAHQLNDTVISIIFIGNMASKQVAIKNGMHIAKRITYFGEVVDVFCVKLHDDSPPLKKL